MRISKKIYFLPLVLGIPAFAQVSFNSIQAPSSPLMPTISSPTISQGIYIPTMPSDSAQKKIKQKTSENQQQKTEAENSSEKKLQLSDSILSTITATDLSTLNNLGLLNEFNTLYSNKYASQENIETKEMLNQVLKKIETIKTSNLTENRQFIQPQEQKQIQQKHPAKILRFNVNGYDILKTCRKIYISDIQSDGTFLITGDRLYLSDGINRKETFHMLFKTAPVEKNISNFNVACYVSQDYLNENSFLYQLSKREKITANRTGNLLSMRMNEYNWKLELLIDLGESS